MSKIAPHVVLGAPWHSELLTREIFGLILPLVAYDTLDESSRASTAAAAAALYPFSHDSGIERLLTHVMSGGVSINDALFHVGQHDLPFGGIGESGMGHYHGREGFETFSKLRPIFHQARLSSVGLLAPPYGRLAERMLAFLDALRGVGWARAIVAGVPMATEERSTGLVRTILQGLSPRAACSEGLGESPSRRLDLSAS